MLPRLTRFAPRLLRPRASQLLAGCGLLIGLMLAAAVGWYIVTARQTVLNDAKREMRNDALMLAEEEDRLLQSVDIVQLSLIQQMRKIGIETPEQFVRLMGTREVHENLADRIAGVGYIATISLSDRNGDMRNFSREWPVPRMNDADRDFIRALNVEHPPERYISEPSVSKTKGDWTLYISRRFDAPDGTLLGFVVSTLRVELFEKVYAQLPLTGGGSFVLYRRDGIMLARYPRIDLKLSNAFSARLDFGRLLEQLDNGELRRISVLDGKERLIVPRALAHFPLIIAVTDTIDSILRDWWDTARLLFTTTVLLELAIGGTIWLAIRQVRSHEMLRSAEAARVSAEAELTVAVEQERAARVLHQRELRFDAAMNNLMQGLFMVDHQKRILVMNHRFRELFAIPDDIVAADLDYASLHEVLITRGNLQQVDVAFIAQRRDELIALNIQTAFTWELSDGRAFTVTHQPTDEGWLTTVEDITQRRAAEARISHLAHYDSLTGLPNRALFREQLEHSMAFARRGRLVALHCLNLDRFKAINDTLGHPIGDGLLQAVAERLRRGLRETDLVARLGGDEFAIVQSEIDSPVDATGLASRMIELIEEPFDIEGHQIIIGMSVGIAFAPGDVTDADKLLKCADLALYRAKSDGRGVFRLFEAEMDAAMQARRTLELDLRHALRDGQLELFYQPQIDVRGRCISGCEALLRWRHPTLGLVPPDRFIPLAEETGLILPIGEWVLREACVAAAGWADELRVAVNLSAVQFKSPDLVGAVVDALRHSGLPANRLELEITETVVLQDTDSTLATLHKLRDLGIQVAMDDFGTGYSSLSYLTRFPFDRIKIDQSFVRELGKQYDCVAIIRAVVALGRDLGMAITAEGVETWQQLDTLERAGCSEIQGYLFSRPLPGPVLIELLRSPSAIADLWPSAGSRTPLRMVNASGDVSQISA